MTMHVYLGNHDATEAYTDDEHDDDGQQLAVSIPGKQRTEVTFEHDHVRDAADEVADLVRYHFRDGSGPKWVSSDNDRLAQRLALDWDCDVRPFLPEGEQSEHRERPSVVALLGPVASMMLALPLLLMLGRFYLRTNAGIDWQSDLMGSAAGVPAKYMALSATSGESAAHTSLAGEITTASGGLIRVAATYAHTTAAATYTLTKTITANGSDALPVTVKQIGLLTASSSGILAFEKIVTDTLYAVSGDAATFTYTVTP